MLHEVNKTYKYTYSSVSQVTNHSSEKNFKGSPAFEVENGELKRRRGVFRKALEDNQNKKTKKKSTTYTINKTKENQWFVTKK